MVPGWRHLRRLAVAVSLAVAGATLAGAADLAKTWEAGGGAIYTSYANGSHIGDSVGFEVRGSYHFSDKGSAELTIQRGSAGSTESETDVTYDLTKWVINYVHELKPKKPDQKLSPFVLLGVGRFTASGNGSYSSEVFQAGGGLRMALKKNFGLRFDGILWHYHGDGEVIGKGHWFAFDVAAGVSWFIGGPAK
jgi:hypothetical protein